MIMLFMREKYDYDTIVDAIIYTVISHDRLYSSIKKYKKKICIFSFVPCLYRSVSFIRVANITINIKLNNRIIII